MVVHCTKKCKELLEAAQHEPRISYQNRSR